MSELLLNLAKIFKKYFQKARNVRYNLHFARSDMFLLINGGMSKQGLTCRYCDNKKNLDFTLKLFYNAS